jgi:hypothetical protein
LDKVEFDIVAWLIPASGLCFCWLYLFKTTERQKLQIWLFVNFLGLLTSFFIGKQMWIWPEKSGLGGPADGMVAVLILLPLDILFGLINIVAIVTILLKLRGQRRWKAILYWAIVVILWIVNNEIFEFCIRGRMGS